MTDYIDSLTSDELAALDAMAALDPFTDLPHPSEGADE